MKSLLYALCICGIYIGQAQSIEGSWKTIDDESGEPRSVVKITQRDGEFYGSIVKLFRSPEEDQNPSCEECPGKRKNQKIIGMEIISDMKFDRSEKVYGGGEILDPESGNVYDCKLWKGEDGNLKVRGYLMFFYRTQTWLPYEE